MGGIKAPAPEEFDAGHAEWLRSQGVLPLPTTQKPEVVGIGAAQVLGQRAVLVWAGRVYHVPPVPFPEARDLLELEQLYDALPEEAPREAWEALTGRLAGAFRALVRPRGLVMRWRWWRGYNPFLSLSPAEVGQLLGFFSTCRGMSRLDVVSTGAANHKAAGSRTYSTTR